MTVAPTPVDRRQRRSQECREAIAFQLQHLVERYDLRNLVLSDASGLVVACAGDDDEGRALAAYAPVFSRRLDRGARDEIIGQLGTFLPEADGQSLSVRRFRLEGTEHFLCVVGQQRLCRQANLYRAVTGIRRIVEETAA